MVDLLDEVQDDLKQEQTIGLIKKYGTYTIFFMAVILLVTTGNLWWKNFQESRIHKEGGEFLISSLKLRANKLEDAMKEFKVLAHDGQTAYAVLANINAASFEQAKKEYEQAASSYKGVMEHSNTPKLLSEYAELMYLKAKLSSDNANKQELLKQLQAFAKDKQTFKFSALELLAALQIELGLKTEAKQTTDLLLTDQHVPGSIKMRTEQLVNYIN